MKVFKPSGTTHPTNTKKRVSRTALSATSTTIKETKQTVTDIALQVGYNSVSKFIAMFKRIEGVLPSDYRTNF